MEMLLESKVLLSSKFFHTNLLELVFKNSNPHEILLFYARGLKLGHFDIFKIFFPFLAFLILEPVIL